MPTPRQRAPHLPGRAALRSAPRLREAGGFHGLAQFRGGALGSAVDQGPQGPREGVVPRQVAREDPLRGEPDLAEREARISLGRDPFRLEPEILAVAGERVFRRHTGRGLPQELSEGPQVGGGALAGACGTARGERLTERCHEEVLRRGFICSQAVWECDEVTETQQAHPEPPRCCRSHMSRAMREDDYPSALRCLEYREWTSLRTICSRRYFSISIDRGGAWRLPALLPVVSL